MPYVAGPLDDSGSAVIDVLIGVDENRQRLLAKHQFPIPPAILIRAQIDTGAAVTMVDPRVLKTLDLTPIGTLSISMPSAELTRQVCNQFTVSVSLRDENTGVEHPSVTVIEAAFWPEEGIQAVIGRDLLKHCSFLFDGGRNAFWFAF
jgi:hypothetical protein